MQLGALTNYLQHQTFASPHDKQGVDDPEAMQLSKTLSEAASNIELNEHDYKPSTRQILITAIAEEFDVTELTQNDINRLQHRLGHYGLLNPGLLNAMQALHRESANSDVSADTVQPAGISPSENISTIDSHLPQRSIDALAVIQQRKHDIDTNGAFTQKKQVNELHSLLSNLATARDALLPAKSI